MQDWNAELENATKAKVWIFHFPPSHFGAAFSSTAFYFLTFSASPSLRLLSACL